MGRPTKLTAALIDEAKAYLTGDSITEGEELPTIEGLANRLNITRETLYQWEKENTAFSDILEDLRQLQSNKLIQRSLTNKYNPTISKMMLTKHGYVEKHEVEEKSDTTITVRWEDDGDSNPV